MFVPYLLLTWFSFCHCLILYNLHGELYIIEQICYVAMQQTNKRKTANADCLRIREVYRCHF